MIVGPYTLALDGVEVDEENRKVAVFSVWASTVPYVLDGKTHRVDFLHPVFQYRVEGRWDGARWISVVQDRVVSLPEYRVRGFWRLPELHRPDFAYPTEEHVR